MHRLVNNEGLAKIYFHTQHFLRLKRRLRNLVDISHLQLSYLYSKHYYLNDSAHLKPISGYKVLLIRN